MKSLERDSLFSIFEKGDEEVYKDLDHKDELDNNFIIMGMVIRGVENYFLIDQLYFNRYGEHYVSVKEKLKLKYFIGLNNYLQRITEFDSKTASSLRDEFGNLAIVYALQTLLFFFEEKEMYEDCILIKKYLDIFSSKSLFIE